MVFYAWYERPVAGEVEELMGVSLILQEFNFCTGFKADFFLQL